MSRDSAERQVRRRVVSFLPCTVSSLSDSAARSDPTGAGHKKAGRRLGYEPVG